MLGQTIRHTAVIKARDTCCVKARDTLLCQTTRHTTVSKHDAGAVTHTATVKHCCSVTNNILNCKRTSKHRAPHISSTDLVPISRMKCFGTLGREERRAAAVSKHPTGTVGRQTIGALQLIVAFALRGGGQLLQEYISLRCALGGGRSVPAKASTPLANTSEHNTPLLCQARDNPAMSKHDKCYCVKARDRLPSQSTRHMRGQTNRHTAVSNHGTHAVSKQETHCCVKPQTHFHIKARRRYCDAHGRRQTLLLCHSTTHTTVRAIPSIERRIHPRPHYPSPEKNALELYGRGRPSCCCV